MTRRRSHIAQNLGFAVICLVGLVTASAFTVAAISIVARELGVSAVSMAPLGVIVLFALIPLVTGFARWLLAVVGTMATAALVMHWLAPPSPDPPAIECAPPTPAATSVLL